jgi:hypothetical protein
VHWISRSIDWGRFEDGEPGFVPLAGRANPAHGDFGSARALQDHDYDMAHAA